MEQNQIKILTPSQLVKKWKLKYRHGLFIEMEKTGMAYRQKIATAFNGGFATKELISAINEYLGFGKIEFDENNKIL